ncbi:GNAT family N-acetyltransferase [Pseudomonas sp. PSE14]|uniref:GNAT family N-acetyltransferase n=1 Tax=Pseudomonas sp. PSE14 TaxID=3016341 RepID=UPI0023D8A0A2|nr:GNAT family N-acetyltransferase [Pseudomonas sp. PSE14]WEJ74636.1 GNAT family N-acetyltransferase [Pseudomonas sp. PSE14]
MDYAILTTFDEVSNYIKQVSKIADNNKNSFGFLSATAYEQMASKGQLWVAVNKDLELKGYLMFGGTMPTIKVFQVYACKSTKGHGLGKQLIDKLKSFAKERNYHSIAAKVASDLPANDFWERNGFAVYKQVKGGKTKNRTINIRGYSLEENDLFGRLNNEKTEIQPTGPVLRRAIYALDLNLILDICKARIGHSQVLKIMQVGFQGGFSVCITPEFKNELERQSKNFPDDLGLRLAQAFPEIKSENDTSAIADSLRTIIFPSRSSNRRSARNDESDLIHLAHCISAKIDGFITREKALLRACNEIKHKYGVSILSPDEISFSDNELPESFNPLNSDFSISTSPANDKIKNFLDSYEIPEAIKSLIIETSPIKPAISVNTASIDERLFGIYFAQKPIKSTASSIAALYVDETSPQSTAAIDHFLEIALRRKMKFSYRLDLYIGKDQALTEETLIKKGFIKSNDHFFKIISNAFPNNKNWAAFSREIKSFSGLSIPEKFPSKKEIQNTGICLGDSNGKFQIFSWFDFETIIGPRFILTADRECILVPIQEKYANGLLGNVKNQLSLLSSHEQTLLLEKAYFRSPKRSNIFKKGGIIAFYISGTKSIQEIVGFARITYSDVIKIDEATIKLDRQGVLSREELLDVSDKDGKIHVFTFDNFLEFDKRVSFTKAKRLELISNANLVSPEKIEIDKLRTLIGEAFNE